MSSDQSARTRRVFANEEYRYL